MKISSLPFHDENIITSIPTAVNYTHTCLKHSLLNCSHDAVGVSIFDNGWDNALSNKNGEKCVFRQLFWAIGTYTLSVSEFATMSGITSGLSFLL